MLSNFLYIKKWLLLLLSTCLFFSHVQAQKQIENYLLKEKLVSKELLIQYQQKEKQGDEFKRLMIRALKKEKGFDSEEMEKEYERELKIKSNNKDTLLVLTNILEISIEKKFFPDEISDAEKNRLLSYAKLLDEKTLISD